MLEASLENNAGFYRTSRDNPFLDPICKLNLKETSEFVKSFPMANNGLESRGFVDVSAERGAEGVNSVTKRNVEAPSTPGRPIFNFSVGNNLSRKSFPSKWDDAEKWLISGSSCHDSPAHHHGFKPSDFSKMAKHCIGVKPQGGEVFAEKSRVTEEKVSKAISAFQVPISLDHHSSARTFNEFSASAHVLLKGDNLSPP
ncbi:unnamed protein product [Ilex paraguariensis]|uniref:Uncharacterized protein n=1 Tax=Ilex paraguariensis TaxID=185542 RepID=A0ABC8TBA5_9AQUA